MSRHEPDVFPATDREYFATGESAPRIGWEDRPAVVVVDLSEAFLGERPEFADTCIEHTACDAAQSVISHEVSLFDRDMNYAVVSPLEEEVDRLPPYLDHPA